MNALFHNDKVDELEEYITFLKEVGADRIIWGDPAVLMAARVRHQTCHFIGIRNVRDKLVYS